MHCARHLGQQRTGLELEGFDGGAVNFVGELDITP